MVKKKVMYVASLHDKTHSNVLNPAMGGSYHHHHNTGTPFAWAGPELVKHVRDELNFWHHHGLADMTNGYSHFVYGNK